MSDAYADHILLWILFAAGFTCSAAGYILSKAWNDPTYYRRGYKLVLTPAGRYALTYLAFAISLVALGVPIIKFGVHDILAALAAYRAVSPSYGYAVSLLAYIAVGIPVFIVPLTLRRIHRDRPVVLTIYP